MSKKIVIILSACCIALGVVAGTYIFSKLSHNKAYEKGLFVNSEVKREYAGYIC